MRNFVDRKGLVLEVLLSACILVGVVVGTFFLLLGFGAHGESGPGTTSTVLLFASWITVLLGLVLIGLVVIIDTLVQAKGTDLRIGTDQLRSLSQGYRIGYEIKLTCATAVVFFGTIALFGLTIIAVDSMLLAVPEIIYSIGRAGLVSGYYTLPWLGPALLCCVLVHALGRAGRVAFEAI